MKYYLNESLIFFLFRLKKFVLAKMPKVVVKPLNCSACLGFLGVEVTNRAGSLISNVRDPKSSLGQMYW
jgi:hypothetical protein